jgi:biopolymer transport protein ExbB/TolQ
VISNLFGAFTGMGAPFAYAIIIIFSYGVTIWGERWWKFNRIWTLELEELRTAVTDKQWDLAGEISSQHPVSQFIDIAAQDKNITWDDLAVVSPMVEEKVTKRISALSMVANISTMLGLLGTVYGLIYALEGLDDASNIERTARLSSGIAAAMLTTAWGLIAGLPMMFAHNTLQRKCDEILSVCQSIAAQIVRDSTSK